MTEIPESITLRRLRYDTEEKLLAAWLEKKSAAAKDPKNGAAVYAHLAKLEYDVAALLSAAEREEILVDMLNRAFDRIEVLERAYSGLSRQAQLASLPPGTQAAAPPSSPVVLKPDCSHTAALAE